MAQNYMFMPLEELKLLSYEQLMEAKTEVESIDPLDVNRYNIIVNTLAEKTPAAPAVVTTGEVATERTPFEFIQSIDFDKHCEMPGINRIVQLLMDKKAKATADQVTADLEKRIDSLIRGFDEERTNWEFQSKRAQEELSRMGESNLIITEEKNKYKLEAEELDRRFRALEAKYAEDVAAKDAEIKRLKDREEDLQIQIANAPAPTVRIPIEITVDEDLDTLIRQANERKAAEQKRKEEERLAKRPKITNKRYEKEYGVGAKTAYLAELVGNYPGLGNDGDTIRIGIYDINQYVEVSNEEARFLREQAANAAAEVAVTTEEVQHIPLVEAPEVPVVAEVPQFPEETGPIVVEGHEVANEQPSVQLPTEVTREEFEAFKRAVEERFVKIEEVVA